MNNPRIFRSLTWITLEKFDEIVPVFKRQLIKYHEDAKPNRKKAVWWWQKWRLITVEEKLFFILFYYRIYPTLELIAFLFGMWSRGRAHERYTKLSVVLENTLWEKQVLPERKTSKLEQVIRNVPSIKDVFVDGVERQVQRPKKSRYQKKYYSWKQKKHTAKNIVVSDEKKKILYLSSTRPWTEHDKRISDAENIFGNIPDNVTAWTDLWFYWTVSKYPNKDIIMPHKKPKWKELPDKLKEENSTISWLRVLIENAIWWIKRLSIVRHRLRMRLYWDYATVEMNMKDKIINISVGIHNLVIC